MDIHMQKNEIGPLSHSITKVNSKCIKDLNVRTEMVKLQEENKGENLLDIGLGNDFLDVTPKTGNTRKNKQVGLHHTKNLLHSKESNQQNEKITCAIGENICKLFT